ncbi:hypothetical protein [Lysobacter sp. CA199]|uniref:hypothetical protein n=1 Tax=Lysobacter sp. CA199 TaxID=3455608 RepID=UPI003F8D7BCA
MGDLFVVVDAFCLVARLPTTETELRGATDRLEPNTLRDNPASTVSRDTCSLLRCGRENRNRARCGSFGVLAKHLHHAVFLRAARIVVVSRYESGLVLV